jgi:hypothetical protein
VIANRKENRKKLTDDYKGLIVRYHDNQEQMVHGTGMDGSEVILPVIVDAWTYGKEFVIEDSRNEYQVPPAAASHFDELFAAHATSNVYNNTNIRIDDWKIQQDQFIIHAPRTTYFNSLITEGEMDSRLSNGFIVRDLFECGPGIHPLNNSHLFNHLAFNGFVIFSDGIVLVKRNSSVSISKRTVGDHIGTGLKAKYVLDQRNFHVEGLHY